MARVLADGKEQILRPGRGKLICKPCDIKGVNLPIPRLGGQFGSALGTGRGTEIVRHHAPPGVVEPCSKFGGRSGVAHGGHDQQ